MVSVSMLFCFGQYQGYSSHLHVSSATRSDATSLAEYAPIRLFKLTVAP